MQPDNPLPTLPKLTLPPPLLHTAPTDSALPDSVLRHSALRNGHHYPYTVPTQTSHCPYIVLTQTSLSLHYPPHASQGHHRYPQQTQQPNITAGQSQSDWMQKPYRYLKLLYSMYKKPRLDLHGVSVHLYQCKILQKKEQICQVVRSGV